MELISQLKSFFGEGKEDKYLTDDFNKMVVIIIMNSLGFFYLSFVTSFVANNVLRISGTKLGFIFSSWTIGNIISATIAGIITDKVSKKKLIALGSFGRGLSYFICFFGIIYSNYNAYLIGYITLGLGVGFYWTPFDTLISEKSHKHHRSYAFSRRYLGIGLGNLLGGLIGFIILKIAMEHAQKQYGIYFSTLILYGIMNWVAGIIFMKTIDEDRKYEYVQEDTRKITEEWTGDQTAVANQGILSDENDKKQEEISTREINKKRLYIGLGLLLLTFFLSMTNSNISQPFLQIYMMNNITENEINVMLIYMPSGIFSLLIAPKLGNLADGINPNYGILLTSTIGSLLTYLLISTNIPWLFAIFLCFDVAIANVNTYILNNIMSRVSRTHRGKVLGARTIFQNLGAFIGPILGGFVYDELGDRWPFLISIFVELSLIVFYISAFNIIKNELEEK